jgi:hypothetical protein
MRYLLAVMVIVAGCDLSGSTSSSVTYDNGWKGTVELSDASGELYLDVIAGRYELIEDGVLLSEGEVSWCCPGYSRSPATFKPDAIYGEAPVSMSCIRGASAARFEFLPETFGETMELGGYSHSQFRASLSKYQAEQ